MSEVVVVRYWAAAKAAAGRPDEEYPAVGTLAELLDAVRARYGEGSQLDVVLGRCSYLVDVRPGAVVDVLPPFAGGSRDHGTSRGRARLVHV